jgi:hypothetical protein
VLRIMPRARNASFIQQMRIFAVRTRLPPAVSSTTTLNLIGLMRFLPQRITSQHRIDRDRAGIAAIWTTLARPEVVAPIPGAFR